MLLQAGEKAITPSPLSLCPASPIAQASSDLQEIPRARNWQLGGWTVCNALFVLFEKGQSRHGATQNHMTPGQLSSQRIKI